jgi:hypothetical protein
VNAGKIQASNFRNQAYDSLVRPRYGSLRCDHCRVLSSALQLQGDHVLRPRALADLRLAEKILHCCEDLLGVGDISGRAALVNLALEVPLGGTHL